MANIEQTKKNLIINIISFFINAIIGLLYTPYLVEVLGISAYGILTLSLIINQYINVITGSITSSLTRFYAISIHKQQWRRASKYLSSSFSIILLIILFLIPISYILIIHIDSIFNIPQNLILSSQLLFIFTILGFFISLISSLYNISLYAINRLDYLNYIKIIRVTLRVILAILFLTFVKNDIIFIGISTLLSELCILILSYKFFNNTKNNSVIISFKFFNQKYIQEIFIMTSWIIIHQIGDTALYRTDSLIINKYWSASESGIIGAFTEIGYYVMLTISILSSLYGPLILISFSKGDHESVKNLTLNNSTLIGMITAIISGILIGFSSDIIGLWIGYKFSHLNNWLIIKQISIPFYTAAGIYAFVFRSWNKVKLPALTTLIFGAINIAIILIIFNLSHSNTKYISYALIATTVIIIIQSFGLNTFIFVKIYREVSYLKILLIFLKILFVLIFTILLCIFFRILGKSYTIYYLISAIIFIGIASMALCYILLDKNQQHILNDYYKSLKSKFI